MLKIARRFTRTKNAKEQKILAFWSNMLIFARAGLKVEKTAAKAILAGLLFAPTNRTSPFSSESQAGVSDAPNQTTPEFGRESLPTSTGLKKIWTKHVQNLLSINTYSLPKLRARVLRDRFLLIIIRRLYIIVIKRYLQCIILKYLSITLKKLLRE